MRVQKIEPNKRHSYWIVGVGGASIKAETSDDADRAEQALIEAARIGAEEAQEKIRSALGIEPCACQSS